MSDNFSFRQSHKNKSYRVKSKDLVGHALLLRSGLAMSNINFVVDPIFPQSHFWSDTLNEKLNNASHFITCTFCPFFECTLLYNVHLFKNEHTENRISPHIFKTLHTKFYLLAPYSVAKNKAD